MAHDEPEAILSAEELLLARLAGFLDGVAAKDPALARRGWEILREYHDRRAEEARAKVGA